MTPENDKKIEEIYKKMGMFFSGLLSEYNPVLVMAALESEFTFLFWSHCSRQAYIDGLQAMIKGSEGVWNCYDRQKREVMN